MGDAVVTGFAGVAEPGPVPPLPAGAAIVDETLIDPDGVAAHVISLAAPAYVWDARVWPAEPVRDFLARDIGQVFGVALDDAAAPNLYFAATSAYGLHIVAPDADSDGRPERLRTGGANASWMAGMWGMADPAGGPGSIWKADGKTGEISLFANIGLGGKPNAGPGLGNLAYDPVHKQMFVSDLSTGMIHRLGLDGQERDVFDHGVSGRGAASLETVPYDDAARLDITSGDFDSEDPESWGYTDSRRAVWGLAVHAGRLYYAVAGDSQIWSVGIDKKTGALLTDARWEIDVPKKPKLLPVSDIAFTRKGAMLLAQRGEVKSTYDYGNFANPGKARLYRYWLENPDDPATPSRWILEPEEYAVGFPGDNRLTDGGIDLNYGYTSDGYLDPAVCEASLWTTGDNLRQSDELKDALLPGGPLAVDGLQGMPAGPVKIKNTPPWASYMVDNNPANTGTDPSLPPQPYSDATTHGWMGDVAIYRTGCGGSGSIAGGSGAIAGGTWGGAGYAWSDPPYVSECTPGIDCPPVAECGGGPDCPPPPPRACLIPRGGFACDQATGTWRYSFTADTVPGLDPDTIGIVSTSPGISVSNGPELPVTLPGTMLDLSGASPGQLVTIGLCLFDAAARDKGEPFDCCKTTVTIRYPRRACLKQ